MSVAPGPGLSCESVTLTPVVPAEGEFSMYREGPIARQW